MALCRDAAAAAAAAATAAAAADDAVPAGTRLVNNGRQVA